MPVLLLLLAVGQALAQGPGAEELTRIEAAAPARATATPAAPRRLLVLNANAGFDHTAIPYGSAAFEAMGRRTSAFEATVTADLGILSPAGLAPFDALVINNGYGFVLEPAAREALVAFVRGGKGLVGIHAASANFEGWPDGWRLFGARFASHPWVPKAEWAVRLDEPVHPLNAAFAGQGFRVRDEIYTFTDFARESVRVLLSLDLGDGATAAEPHDDPFVPVSWVRREGAGRVFFCSLGHEHAVFWNSPILRHLLDGAQYALGDLEVPDEPDLTWLWSDLRAGPYEAVLPHFRSVERLAAGAANDADRRAALEANLLALMDGGTPLDIRRRLAEPLSWIASRQSVTRLAPWLGDSELSGAACNVLVRVGGDEAAEAVHGALRDGHRLPSRVRASLCGALADLGCRPALTTIHAQIDGDDPELAAAALRAVARLGGGQECRLLSQLFLAPTLRPLCDEAHVRVAVRAAAEGETILAEATLLDLVGPERLPATRALALGGLVAIGSPEARALTLAALAGTDDSLAESAARLLADLHDRPLLAELEPVYPRLSPERRAAVLRALARRGEGDAGALVLAATGDEATEVALAALAAVASVCGAEAVPRLVDLCAADDPPTVRLAFEALNGLSGDDVDDALLERLVAADAPALLWVPAVLAERGTVAAVPVLLQTARGRPTEVPARLALGRLAGEADLPALIELLRLTEGPPALAAAAQALARVASRSADRDTAADAVVAGLDGAPLAARIEGLDVLCRLGGERAVAALEDALADPEPALADAALTALAERCDDERALPILRRLATAANGDARDAAISGVLRLLYLEAGRQPDEAARAAGEVLDLATRAEDRLRALAVLRFCRVPAALELAAARLGEPGLVAAAAGTIDALTRDELVQGLPLAAVAGPQADAALAARLAAIEAATAPWRVLDIGALSSRGWIEADDGGFLLRAAGADVWDRADGCLLLAQPVDGDCTITARVASLEHTNDWAKAGVMLRESDASGGRNVFVCVSPVSGGSFQWRAEADGPSVYQPPGGTIAPPHWVRLTRTGALCEAFYSADGTAWTKAGEVALDLPPRLLAGLAVTSHNAAVATNAVFDSVVLEP